MERNNFDSKQNLLTSASKGVAWLDFLVLLVCEATIETNLHQRLEFLRHGAVTDPAALVAAGPEDVAREEQEDADDDWDCLDCLHHQKLRLGSVDGPPI